MRGRLLLFPNEEVATLRCKKCGRRWGDVIGRPGEPRVRVLADAKGADLPPRSARMLDEPGYPKVRHNPRTGNPANQQVVISKSEPGERVSIQCHSRCGVRKTIRTDTLARAFQHALDLGRPDVYL